MIVSWDWLKQYVALDMTPAELAERLMMAGLNHEDTHQVGDDFAIHLEVTSNRPDCLGHLGIAREISVLWNRPLKVPSAAPRAGDTPVADLARVRIENPQQCTRYTARVIRGVKVGPSPPWLLARLATLGVAEINNVVDITNYVLFECGQPLHAFDLARLSGREIVVRQARQGETLVAINHKTYALDTSMCVISDCERAVGLAGVMGGAETEVSPRTTELLIESAEFDPLSIRTTARKLGLRSASSDRFERGLDPQGVDWASRRCCELILELAGGQLAEGHIDVGGRPAPRDKITLRFAQLPRVLGIDVDPAEARRILTALGVDELKADRETIEVVPPSWRRDLSREIDLVEEVARIHGYDKIPEDSNVPMAPSHRTPTDRVLAKARHVLTAAGFDEAMTLSVVDEPWSEAFSPWTAAAALRSTIPVLRGADRLRHSLVPSLLGARQTNEAAANAVIELFEIAKVYLPRAGQLPDEQLMIGLTSGNDYLAVKGVIEGLLAALNQRVELEVRPTRQGLLDERESAELRVHAARARSVVGLPRHRQRQRPETFRPARRDNGRRITTDHTGTSGESRPPGRRDPRVPVRIPRFEPRRRRSRVLGRPGPHRPRGSRALRRFTPVSGRVSRSAAVGPGAEEPAVHADFAIARRHAHQRRGRSNSHPRGRCLPGCPRRAIAGLSRALSLASRNPFLAKGRAD